MNQRKEVPVIPLRCLLTHQDPLTSHFVSFIMTAIGQNYFNIHSFQHNHPTKLLVLQKIVSSVVDVMTKSKIQMLLLFLP